MMTTFSCKAILFDLDGTLVDSTASVERNWRLWSERAGLEFDEVMRVAYGRPALETMQLVAPSHLSVVEEAAWLEVKEATDTEGVVSVPGAAKLLHSLSRSAWCVVTSATVPVATARLRAGELPLPELLITADDVTQGKPNPEPFLLAAARLGLQPADCVVIEDSPVGVAAARAAGMRVIGVAATHTPTDLESADLVVDALSDLGVQMFDNGRIGLEIGVR
ncbi:MAG: HAD-IA family hydrolase [Chloroflexi bacterium]|nr:HAD-IA family hydrolase [Chloroflexota bacterium]